MKISKVNMVFFLLIAVLIVASLTSRQNITKPIQNQTEKNHDEQNKTKSKNKSSISKGSEAANTKSNGPSDKTNENNSLSSKNGLCPEVNFGNKFYLFDELVRHLHLQKPKFIMFPATYVSCFKDQMKEIFEIITYDPKIDFLYDRFGKIHLQLSLKETFANIQSLLLDRSFSSLDFGFSNNQEMLSFLSTMPPHPQEPILVYRIDNIGVPEPKAQHGTYTEHVGLKFISWDYFRSRILPFQSDNEVFIHGIPRKESQLNQRKFHLISRLVQRSHQLQSPNTFFSQGQFGILTQISKNKPLILIPEGADDLYTINYANMLRKNGFKDISIVLNGLASETLIQTETPRHLKSVAVIKWSQLDFSNDVIIDTRSLHQIDFFEINGSHTPLWRSVPTGFNALTFLDQKHHFRFLKSVFQNTDWSKVSGSQKKRIVFIGRNEYDWTVPYFVHYLEDAKIQFQNYAWLRDGFDYAKTQLKLGLWDKEFQTKIGIIELKTRDSLNRAPSALPRHQAKPSGNISK